MFKEIAQELVREEASWDDLDEIQTLVLEAIRVQLMRADDLARCHPAPNALQ